jgi:phage replication O-like protein O
MANPSLKNGYISVANELVEVFARSSIPGNEMRIIWVLWRKTWGWSEGVRKKDWDWISYSQFEKMTGMKHMSVGKCLKSVVGKRLLLKEENRYKFNQNYNEWLVGKKLPPVVKRLLPSRQTATEISRQTATHKRNKDTNTKERGADSPPTPKEITEKFFSMVDKKDQEYEEFIIKLSESTKMAVERTREEIKKFSEYWMEMNQTGTKQRWQKEKVFEVKRRLTTWLNNNNKWSQNNNSKPKKIWI